MHFHSPKFSPLFSYVQEEEKVHVHPLLFLVPALSLYKLMAVFHIPDLKTFSYKYF